MMNKEMVKAGGICLILLAIINITIDIIDAIAFNFPMMMSGPIQDALPKIFEHQLLLNELLTFMTVVPFLLIPGAIGVYEMFSEKNRGLAMNALIFGLFGALAWILSRMFWPSLNWYSAHGIAQPGPAISALSYMLLGGLNSLGDVFIGAYMRYTALGIFFFLISLAGLRQKNLPVWFCYFGIVLAIVGWVMIAIRAFFGDPMILDYGFNFFPVVNFWVFIMGCYMVLPSQDRR